MTAEGNGLSDKHCLLQTFLILYFFFFFCELKVMIKPKGSIYIQRNAYEHSLRETPHTHYCKEIA